MSSLFKWTKAIGYQEGGFGSCLAFISVLALLQCQGALHLCCSAEAWSCGRHKADQMLRARSLMGLAQSGSSDVCYRASVNLYS